MTLPRAIALVLLVLLGLVAVSRTPGPAEEPTRPHFVDLAPCYLADSPPQTLRVRGFPRDAVLRGLAGQSAVGFGPLQQGGPSLPLGWDVDRDDLQVRLERRVRLVAIDLRTRRSAIAHTHVARLSAFIRPHGSFSPHGFVRLEVHGVPGPLRATYNPDYPHEDAPSRTVRVGRGRGPCHRLVRHLRLLPLALRALRGRSWSIRITGPWHGSPDSRPVAHAQVTLCDGRSTESFQYCGNRHAGISVTPRNPPIQRGYAVDPIHVLDIGEGLGRLRQSILRTVRSRHLRRVRLPSRLPPMFRRAVGRSVLGLGGYRGVTPVHIEWEVCCDPSQTRALSFERQQDRLSSAPYAQGDRRVRIGGHSGWERNGSGDDRELWYVDHHVTYYFTTRAEAGHGISRTQLLAFARSVR